MENGLAQNNFSRVVRGVLQQSSGQLGQNVASGISSNYKIEVKNADSLWKILERVFASRINNLDEAGRTFFISTLSNSVLQVPPKYGLKPDGVLRVGDVLDVTSLVKDEQRISSLLDKSFKLSPAQKSSILENNKKVASWLSSNPNTEKAVSPGHVNEILNSKPLPPKPAPPPLVAVLPKPVVEPLKMPKIEPIMPVNMPHMEMKTSTPPVVPPITSPIAPPKVSVKSLQNDNSILQAVEKALEEEIDAVYGKKGMFKKTPGLDTAEWALAKKLPVIKFIDYFTGDSNKSGLKAEEAELLAKSESHHKLMQQIIGLMQETKGVVKPYENETVEQFLRRLGRFVMEKHV